MRRGDLNVRDVSLCQFSISKIIWFRKYASAFPHAAKIRSNVKTLWILKKKKSHITAKDIGMLTFFRLIKRVSLCFSTERGRKSSHVFYVPTMHRGASVDDARVLEDTRVLSLGWEKGGAIFGKRPSLKIDAPRVCVCARARGMHLNIVLAGRETSNRRGVAKREDRFANFAQKDPRSRQDLAIDRRVREEQFAQRASITLWKSREEIHSPCLLEQSRFLTEAFDRWRERHERCTGQVRRGESTADGGDATGRREHGRRRSAGRVKSLEDRIRVYVCTCVLATSARGFRSTIVHVRYAFSTRYLFRYAFQTIAIFTRGRRLSFFSPLSRRYSRQNRPVSRKFKNFNDTGNARTASFVSVVIIKHLIALP